MKKEKIEIKKFKFVVLINGEIEVKIETSGSDKKNAETILNFILTQKIKNYEITNFKPNKKYTYSK